MSEMMREKDPLERHIEEFERISRQPGLIELTLKRLHDRHFGLLRIREP